MNGQLPVARLWDLCGGTWLAVPLYSVGTSSPPGLLGPLF